MTTINENGIEVFTCKYCELECDVVFADQDGNPTYIDYCETCCDKHPELMEVANILESLKDRLGYYQDEEEANPQS
tara:strand:- start:1263 stop:1490 length:228 start_codon:yes stop_codon:yes gene_type:complete